MAKTTKTLKLTFLNGKNKKTSVTLGMLIKQNLQTSKTNLELLFEVIDLLKSKLVKK